MKKTRTSLWLNDQIPLIEKAIKMLNKDTAAVHQWTLSSFVRLCVAEKLKKMGIK